MEDSKETDRDLSTENHYFQKKVPTWKYSWRKNNFKSDNWFMMCNRFLGMTQHFQPRARDPANIDRMKSRKDKMRSRTKYKVTKIHITNVWEWVHTELRHISSQRRRCLNWICGQAEVLPDNPCMGRISVTETWSWIVCQIQDITELQEDPRIQTFNQYLPHLWTSSTAPRKT